MTDNPDTEDVQLAKEDFVLRMIAGMDAEDVDALAAKSDFDSHAQHFARMSKLGRRASPETITAEYLKAVAEDDSDADLLEKELNYVPPEYDPERTPGQSGGDYDGRDDEFIAEITGSKYLW